MGSCSPVACRRRIVVSSRNAREVQPTSSSRQLRSGGAEAFPLAAVAALQEGKFIEAVRIVRQARGIDLKDAKAAVDRYVASDPLVRDRIAAIRSERRRRVLFWGVVLALLARLGAYYLARP